MDALGVAAAGAVALGRDGVEVAGEQHGRARARQHAGVAEVAHRSAAGAQHRHHVGGERALAARLRRDVDQLERPGGQALPELAVADRRGHGLPPYRPSAMRYCGIDVSAKAANQQLCTLHERRGPEGMELVATFYEPGTVEEVARTVHGFGRGQAVVAVDAPSGHRLDLLAAGSPLREELGLPAGRYERMRVCDTLLFRRGLPLYPVPSADQPQTAWQRVDAGRLRHVRPARRDRARPTGRPPAGAFEGRVGESALTSGRLCETYPDAIFCALLGHRPGAKRTPSGLQERIAVLKLKGIVDEDGGLWRRTLDELDACAAAYAAYGLAAGLGSWVGHPGEGVVVLPVARAPRPLREAPGPLAPAAGVAFRPWER